MEDATNQALAFTDYARNLVVIYGSSIALAMVTLIMGLRVIRIITGEIGKAMEKRKVDPSLAPFLKSLIAAILKIGLFISVIGMVGIEATGFVAIFGAAGLAVGLALQGTLQNFAAGVIILLLKPFKVGDFIDAVGYMRKLCDMPCKRN